MSKEQQLETRNYVRLKRKSFEIEILPPAVIMIACAEVRDIFTRVVFSVCNPIHTGCTYVQQEIDKSHQYVTEMDPKV